jgi:hypothetical protein
MRPYDAEKTASRPICKVNQRTAQSVVWSGTTCEYCGAAFIFAFFCFPIDSPPLKLTCLLRTSMLIWHREMSHSVGRRYDRDKTCKDYGSDGRGGSETERRGDRSRCLGFRKPSLHELAVCVHVDCTALGVPHYPLTVYEESDTTFEEACGSEKDASTRRDRLYPRRGRRSFCRPMKPQ